MLRYILRRLLLIIPTLLGVMILNFIVVQFTPGGPIEQVLAELEGSGDVTGRFSGGASDVGGGGGGPAGGEIGGDYRGREGVDQRFIEELRTQFGFDQPPLTRFLGMLQRYATFDFGNSYFQDRPVVDLILERLPVSISLGLWTTLLIYTVSIPLGVAKAVRDGSRFDIYSSAAIILGYAIPGYLFAVLLIVLFAGGTYLQWFPLRGLVSDNFDQLSTLGKVGDYLWHITLPVLAMVISGFASLTFLTKNSFLDEINKHYVLTARAKGASPRRVLYRHIFRNAMLLVVAGFPAALIGILFTSSLLIEQIFSLDGLGLLGFQAVLKRDYQIVFATLYMFTFIGLIMNLISDLIYVMIDPRIDFDARG